MTGNTVRRDRRLAYRWGLGGEAICAAFLRLRGYRIVARRARTPAGEIDIVARRGPILAFVEVKARGRQPTESPLTIRQRRRITRAAEAFVAARPSFAGLSIRFDLMLARPWRPPTHIIDAWRPEG